jgi:hypothetical protein
MIKNSRIAASVILTRGPQITRDATPFEQAYFDYKEKLERHDAAVFPQDFYFKKGSVAERKWKEDVLARDTAMKDASKSLTEAVQQQRLDDTTTTQRTTQADTTNDTKKLDRALQRNLYLIVNQQNQWRFPQTDLHTNEYLHEVKQKKDLVCTVLTMGSDYVIGGRASSSRSVWQGYGCLVCRSSAYQSLQTKPLSKGRYRRSKGKQSHYMD